MDVALSAPGEVAALVEDPRGTDDLRHAAADLGPSDRAFGDFAQLQRSAQAWAQRWQQLGTALLDDTARTVEVLVRAGAELARHDKAQSATEPVPHGERP